MIVVLKILFSSLIIICLHELGHYAVLKIFKIPIYCMGISIQPVPHFYIRYKWPASIFKHCLIILSGSITTILGFTALHLLVDYPTMSPVFVAYYFQIICETNPFFSDYVFAYVIYKNKIDDLTPRGINNYRSLIIKYMFSPAWYIHFILWGSLIILLLQTLDLHNIWNM